MMKKTKLKVGIIFGGSSTEHEISIRSAANVYNFLDKNRYEGILLGISRSGQWFLMNEVESSFEPNGQPLHLRMDAKNPGLFNKDGDRIHVDLYFPVLHGTYGEDGNIQGLLNTFNLPFVGTGVLGSALCMNKVVSKQLMQAAGIPVVPFQVFTKQRKEDISFDKLKESFGLPFMVKAANLGSSVGVNKVVEQADLTHAISEAFKYDSLLLVEKFIQGRELECAVIGNRDPRATLAGEIVINPQYEFYTYKAKYLDPLAVELKVPADLSDEIQHKIQSYSIQAYQVLHCQDFARIDVFLANDGHIFLNEINTIPGFTNASMFPMMWADRGIDNKSLITSLITNAQERYKDQDRIVEYKVIN